MRGQSQTADLQRLQAIAVHYDMIRTGQLRPDQLENLIRTGQCGPPLATQTYSWGSACPPGFCPPDNLPEALGRWFAGEREGCRELPYSIVFDAATAGTVTLSESSPVTMCPTRLIAIPEGDSTWTINVIQFGITNQIPGGPMPAAAFAPDAIQSVPWVPDCLKAGQPYTITVERTDALVAEASLNLIFLGPVAG